MGFSIETSVSALTVFFQGILSFLSPCVLPLVPLYIGYLSGGTKTVDEDGTIHYPRRKVMLNTLFFVLGVSFAFFLLGFGFTAAGRFFSRYQILFTRVGGILVTLFGLYQLGLFGQSRLIAREHRLPFHLDRFTMGPLAALLLGFTFSFAWTPCVGPALASVLLMASSAATMGTGFALIGLYTLGFVLPFLAVGLFTSTLLDFFRKHQKVVRYTVKVGGALMVLMGIMMFTGWMNGFSSYLSRFSGGGAAPGTTQTATPAPSDAAGPADAKPVPTEIPSATPAPRPPAPGFTLVDQDGGEHTLSDYQGKTVFLNFWATWCPPCKAEMPDIQALYETWGENEGDLVVLGVANPKSDGYPYNQDVTQEEVESFLRDNEYTYPVVMDTTGDLFAAYGIQAFPTTFMISADGSVFGYASGGLTRSVMDSIVEQTMTGTRSQP